MLLFFCRANRNDCWSQVNCPLKHLVLYMYHGLFRSLSRRRGSACQRSAPPHPRLTSAGFGAGMFYLSNSCSGERPGAGFHYHKGPETFENTKNKFIFAHGTLGCGERRRQHLPLLPGSDVTDVDSVKEAFSLAHKLSPKPTLQGKKLFIFSTRSKLRLLNTTPLPCRPQAPHRSWQTWLLPNLLEEGHWPQYV